MMRPLEWQDRLVALGLPELLAVRDGRAKPWAASVVTGGGKTYGTALLLRALLDAGELPERVVLATSRLSLIADLRRALLLLFPAEMVGEWSGERKAWARICVTTYDSLDVVIEKFGCDLLGCDEAHRTGSEIRTDVVTSIPWRFGMSATLYRGQESATIPGFERVLLRVGWEEAVSNGWIVDYEHRLLTREEWASVEGEGDVRALQGALAMIAAAGGPSRVGPILMLAPDGATAEMMAKIATAAGVRTAAIGQADRKDERAAKIAAHRFGELDALITVDLLTEGVDMPWIRVVALTAIIGSDVKLAQVVGRGCRALRFSAFPEAERFGPKDRMVLLDPAGQFHPGRLGKEERLGLGGEVLKPLPKDPEKRAAACVGWLEKLPLAVAYEPLDAWSSALRDLALRANGPEWRAVNRPLLDATERGYPAPVAWWRELAGLARVGLEVVQPKEQREAIRLVISAGMAKVSGGGMFGGVEAMRGVVTDLILFLRWVAARAEKASEAANQIRGREQKDFIRRAMVRKPWMVVVPEGVLLPGEVVGER